MNRIFHALGWMPLTLACLLLFAGGMLTCTPDAVTELVVVVGSDMATPAEFDGFRVVVTGNDGDVATDRYYFLGDEPGQVVLPADFGVVPKAKDASRKVAVEVWATLAGADLFSNRAITGFIEGKTLRLDMFLAKRCLAEAQACKPNETCRVDGCVPEEVDPSTLPEFESGAKQPKEWVKVAREGFSQFWHAAFDASGNTYAAGVFSDRVVIDGVVHEAIGKTIGMMVSFDPMGKLRWFKTFSDSILSTAHGVIVGKDSKVYFNGWFDGQVTLENEVLDAGSGQDSYIVCFDTNGTLQWLTTFGGQSNVQLKSIALAPNGDVGAVGVYNGTLLFEGGTISASEKVSTDQGFIVRFDSLGKYKFSRVFGGDGEQDTGFAVAFDGDSNMLVSGIVSKGSVDLGGGSADLQAEVSAFVAKYAEDGAYLWSHIFENGSAQIMTGLDVGPDDRVVVAGGFSGTVDFGGGPLTSAGDYDTGIAVFDAAGKHEASVLFGGSALDRARRVRFFPDDILVFGTHTGPIEWDEKVLLDAPDQNAYVLSFAPDLTKVKWAYSLGGSGNDAAYGGDMRGLAVLVAGEFSQSIQLGKAQGVSTGQINGFVLRFEP